MRSGTTLLYVLNNTKDVNISYKPGDHLGVFACNRSELVEKILQRVQSTFDADTPIELQMQKQVHTPNGNYSVFLIYPLSYYCR